MLPALWGGYETSSVCRSRVYTSINRGSKQPKLIAGSAGILIDSTVREMCRYKYRVRCYPLISTFVEAIH